MKVTRLSIHLPLSESLSPASVNTIWGTIADDENVFSVEICAAMVGGLALHLAIRECGVEVHQYAIGLVRAAFTMAGVRALTAVDVQLIELAPDSPWGSVLI